MLRRKQRAFQHRASTGPLASGNERGFSILEVCIALLILLIASLGVATAFAFSVSNNSSAGDRTVAAALAQREMERLRNLDFEDPALDATAEPVVQFLISSGQPWVDNNGRPFEVRLTITDIDTDTSAAAAALPPTGKVIRIDVTPWSNSRMWANGTVTLITTRSAFAPGPNFCGTC